MPARLAREVPVGDQPKARMAEGSKERAFWHKRQRIYCLRRPGVRILCAGGRAGRRKKGEKREENSEMAQTRRCTMCGQEKPINAFYLWKRKTKEGIKDTVHQPCKECLKKRDHKKRQKKKEKDPRDSRHKYRFIRAGVSYKEVIPPEKWPLMEHFLISFCRYARIAESFGKKLNVEIFLREYVKAYSREDVAVL